MGCTSSAPNTIPLNSHTADKSIQFEDETNENPSIEVDVADTEDENRTNETKVLPTCNTMEQTVQLARNNKSTNSLANEKDVPANGHVIESEEATEAPANTQDEVKIPKLELFMEKVFETNHHLNGSDYKLNDLTKNDEEKPPKESTEEAESAVNNNEDAETRTEPDSNDGAQNEVENKEEGAEETEEASPSQSQSSRATRWEALADIAAELPPSLAVDPITGQIYQIALPK